MKKALFILAAIILIAVLSALAIWGYSKLPKSQSQYTKNLESDTKTVLSANTVEPLPIKLQNLGPAPDLSSATGWLNSEPLNLLNLQGKVGLVHFWTYSSIQSIQMSEWLTKLHNRYSEKGLMVIGVHTPQYNFERVQAGVEAAVKRYNLPYAIALDNNYKIWQAYGNTFWPTTYLVDKEGNLAFTSIGADEQDKIETAIQELLELDGNLETAPEQTRIAIPDLYLGLIKLSKFGGTEKPNSQEQIFVFPKKLAKDKFALEGKWSFSQESAMHTQGFGKLRLNFKSKNLAMVAKSTSDMPIKIFVDGKLHKAVVIERADVYELFDSEESKSRTVELEIPRGGLEIYNFSFK